MYTDAQYYRKRPAELKYLCGDDIANYAEVLSHWKSDPEYLIFACTANQTQNTYNTQEIIASTLGYSSKVSTVTYRYKELCSSGVEWFLESSYVCRSQHGVRNGYGLALPT